MQKNDKETVLSKRSASLSIVGRVIWIGRKLVEEGKRGDVVHSAVSATD